MRRDKLSSAVYVVALAAMAAYMGAYIWTSVQSHPATAPVVKAVFKEEITACGVIIRDEYPLLCEGEYVLPAATDGKRVPAGTAVAYVCSGKRGAENLESALTAKAQLEERKELRAHKTLSAPVKAAVLADETAALAEAEKLWRSASPEVITAQQAGVYFENSDGLESVYDDVDVLTADAEQIRQMLNAEPEEYNTAGRILVSTNWYFVSELLSEGALPDEGDDLTLMIDGGQTAQVHLERLIKDGDAVFAVFSGNVLSESLYRARSVDAQIAVWEKSGLRVPEEALCLDEGGYYVFALEGLTARKRYIDIICIKNGYCLVEDREPGGLVAGAEIIVDADGIYDGKVVK